MKPKPRDVAALERPSIPFPTRRNMKPLFPTKRPAWQAPRAIAIQDSNAYQELPLPKRTRPVHVQTPPALAHQTPESGVGYVCTYALQW
jgi:hypothetical protein